jgi:hypothetical protein
MVRLTCQKRLHISQPLFQGDVVHVNLAGQHTVIINSVEVAAALYNQKPHIYGDRPQYPFIIKLAGMEEMTTWVTEGPKYKEHRRLFAQEIGSRATLDRFTSMSEYKTRHFVLTLLGAPAPENLLPQIRA